MNIERDVPRNGPATDLEYDLAHEEMGSATGAVAPVSRSHRMVYVATQTDGYDGDYGYDLTHDVPRR